MNEHDLLDAVGGIDEKYINNAAKRGKKKRKKSRNVWMPVLAAAAVLLLIVGIAIGWKNWAGSGDGRQIAKDPDSSSSSGGKDKSGGK